MYFIVNSKYKVIFGWSAKCGCSHVKKMAYFLENGKTDNIIHTTNDVHILPSNMEEYNLIVVVRNPYSRLVSGFLDKYNFDGSKIHLWDKNDKLTFNNFVHKILEQKWTNIDKHHFCPQTSGHFNDKIKTHSKLKVFDIKNIDYEYIERLFNTKIPEYILSYRGDHINKRVDPLIGDVFDLCLSEYSKYKVEERYFYNNDLKQKVFDFFAEDFKFLKEHNIDCDIYLQNS
jgi:hypothetical protein